MSENINDYLEYTKENIKFIGDKLDVWISMSWKALGVLDIGDTVNTIGVFKYQINDFKPHGIMIPAMIELCPSSMEEVNVEGKPYRLCHFKKGDTFFKHRYLVKAAGNMYPIFTEFIEKGNIPDFISYDNLATVFDIAQKVTGRSIPANHAIFEFIYAHLNRDKDNIRIPYRFTKMTEPPYHLKLKDVTHAATSVTARLIGQYLNDSINVSLINANENNSDVEDMFRQ